MKDWNHVNTLLSVIHQASTAGPKWAKVAAEAADELTKHLEEHTAQATEASPKVPPKGIEDTHGIDPNLGAERLSERRI